MLVRMQEGGLPKAVAAAEIAGRPLRYYDYVMVAFVVVLLLSNVIGAEKRSTCPSSAAGRSARASCSSRSPICSTTS